MSRPPEISRPILNRIAKALLVATCVGLSACDDQSPPASISEKSPAPSSSSSFKPALLATRFHLAQESARRQESGAALSWAVATLEIDPAHAESIALVQSLFQSTHWHFTHSTFPTPLKIPYLAQHGNSIWLAVEGADPSGSQTISFQSVLRYDLETSQVEATLFPSLNSRTNHLGLSPQGKFLIVSRQQGQDSTNLLCAAETLKPITDLGRFPDDTPIECLLAFSSTDLLLAHPEQPDRTLPTRWHIRDSASGQILRTETVAEPVMAAHFPIGSQKLELFHSSGNITAIPLSPAEPVETHKNDSLASYDRMLVSNRSPNFFALRKHHPVETRIGEMRRDPSTGNFSAISGYSPDRQRLLLDLPYSERSRFWATCRQLTSSAPPIPSDSAIVAECFNGHQIIASDRTGHIYLQTRLPRPHPYRSAEDEAVPGMPNPIYPPGLPTKTLPPETLQALRQLAILLHGKSLDPETATFTTLDLRQLESFEWPAPRTLDPIGFQFDTTLTQLKSTAEFGGRRPDFSPLWKRLSLADRTGEIWPAILKWSDGLGFERWHQDLQEANLIRTKTITPKPGQTTDPSPWLARERLSAAIQIGEKDAITQSISTLTPTSIPAASLALSLAIDRREPAWLETLLANFPEIPPTLKNAATVRLLWCQGRKRDAISLWPEAPPDLTAILRREDWLGWEITDFAPAFKSIQQDIDAELEGLILPPDSTPESRGQLAIRLLDPNLEQTIGRQRLSELTIKAALAYADFPEESKTTFLLASQARRLGAPAEPCLRAEALSLTSMGEYAEAHPRWILLLTQHPVTTHVPSDYSEAAYTAFETGDPRQAIEILATGVKRFPNDADFALRAGWIALLTGNGPRAYPFLLAALDLGIPDDQKIRANALLAIAAYQAEQTDDAFIHFENLLALDPSWADEKTIEALDWPEDLKAVLIQLAWQP
jgi:tetratricopeptide (TPR) repeat protein